MIPGWYCLKEQSFYIYFISEDAWCIRFISSNEKVFLDKYDSLKVFMVVKNKKIISSENQYLLKNLFEYGWVNSSVEDNYTGDFFK